MKYFVRRSDPASTKTECKIVVCFFGDGATNEGVFHEAVNVTLSGICPLFPNINNGYGMFSADIKKMTNVEHIHERSAAMTFLVCSSKMEICSGCMRRLSCRACSRGKGPVLIESVTYR